MKKYILPILAIFVFSMYSCNEDAATETKENVKETVKAKTTEPVKTISNTTNNAVKKVEPIKKEQPQTQKIANVTTIKMDRKVHDFGEITSDKQPVKTQFTITNTGKKPLIITNAKGSCGCTVPTWPREPIAPGKSGIIKVSFNPKGKAGKQNKTVTIMANTDPVNTVLNIKSVVNIKK